MSKEFSEEKDLRFDDYVSPVILLLLCSLVPYVGYQLLPPFGLSYLGGWNVGGSDTCFVGKPCVFNIEANYFADDYTVEWQFRDALDTPVKDEDRKLGQEVTYTPELGTYKLTSKQEAQWTSPGAKQVYVEIRNSSGAVVASTVRNITVEQAQADTQTSDATVQIAGAAPSAPAPRKQLAGEVQNNAYLGILFLVPALIYAIAARGTKDKQISAEALKEVFYAQCYYFTPISLFFYILLYGAYFLTDDLTLTFGVFLLMLLGVVIWFVRAEVNSIAGERAMKSKWSAFWIFSWTTLLLLFVGMVILVLISYPDWVRGLGYRLIEYGVIALVFYSFMWKRVSAWWTNRRKQRDTITAQAQG